MKKKIYIGLILIIAIIFFNTKISYGTKSLNIGEVLISADTEHYGGGSGNTLTEAKMLELLKAFGYNGQIKDEIRWETTIEFSVKKATFWNQQNKARGDYWTVKIGNEIVKESVKFDDVKTKFACSENKPNNSEIQNMINNSNSDYVEIYKYQAVIIAKKDLSNLPTSVTAIGQANAGLRYFLDAIYTDSDMEEGRNRQLSEENTTIASVAGTEEAELELPSLRKMIAELIGRTFMAILDVILYIIDAPQRGANSIGYVDTIEAQKYDAAPAEITYSYETIAADSSKNKTLNVSKNKNNTGDPNKQEIINIEGKDEKFNSKTPIPVIPVDVYNIAYGKIGFLDVNFFNVDTTKHSETSKWMFVRKVFAGALHIMIYLCSAFLVVTLILYGIGTVKETVLPNEKKKKQDGLKRVALSIIMLVGTILIMNLCIYGVNALINYLGTGDKEDAILRINIAGDTNYSFSPNLTEFVRFMAQISSVKKIGDKLMYCFLYLVLVIANLIALGVMLLRMVHIIILSVKGPIIATSYSIDKNVFKMSFSEWTIKYLKWTSVQIVLVIGYKIIIMLSRF